MNSSRSMPKSALSSPRPQSSPSRSPNLIHRSSGPTSTGLREGPSSMAPQILMPALSPTMEEGKLAKWHVKVGDPVKSGDVIAEIETDKATMEVEAVDEGKVSEILIPEGTENVKVNTPIAVIDGEGDRAQSTKSVPSQEKAPPPAPSLKGESQTPAPSRDVSGGQPSPPASAAQKDATIPEGTEMVAITVREALRDAMREEMKRDANVFLMGEEVGQYQG